MTESWGAGFMALIGRIIFIWIALMAALMAAGVMLAISIAGPTWINMDSDPMERVTFLFFTIASTGYVFVVAGLPSLLLVVLGEALKLRSFLYYGAGGAVVGLLSYFLTDISASMEQTTDIVPVTYPMQLAAAAGDHRRARLLADRRAQRGRWRDPLNLLT